MPQDQRGWWRTAIAPLSTFVGERVGSLVLAIRAATTEELVRGSLALILVIVLLLMVFVPPANMDGLVTSTKTLAITVIAFYFGLHKATPHGKSSPTGNATQDPLPGPGAPAADVEPGSSPRPSSAH